MKAQQQPPSTVPTAKLKLRTNQSLFTSHPLYSDDTVGHGYDNTRAFFGHICPYSNKSCLVGHIIPFGVKGLNCFKVCISRILVGIEFQSSGTLK